MYWLLSPIRTRHSASLRKCNLRMNSFIPPPHSVLVPLAWGQYWFKTPPISGEVSEGRRGVKFYASIPPPLRSSPLHGDSYLKTRCYSVYSVVKRGQTTGIRYWGKKKGPTSILTSWSEHINLLRPASYFPPSRRSRSWWPAAHSPGDQERPFLVIPKERPDGNASLTFRLQIGKRIKNYRFSINFSRFSLVV